MKLERDSTADASAAVLQNSAVGAWSSKLRPRHYEGVAFVYVRQSTTHQVLNHRESANRQYSLVELAIQLGWPADRVEVIDEDQGQSGATAEGRSGFQRLLAEVGLDHVGIILGIELSRLARSNKDWHQLIELCAIFGTMLADQDGLYDPTDYNDRLLLGLRGIMNEAELHVLQGRMHQALLSKAKRGEVYVRAPVGYVKLPSGEFALDPDEQAQGVIRLIFDEFDRRGSVRAVVQYLQQKDIKLPIRPHSGPRKDQLEWRSVTPSVVNRVLKHELYAGMYRFGYRQTDPRRKKPGQPHAGRIAVSPERYHALIPDHCPAYISRERFLRNRQRIYDNRFCAQTRGAARDGRSLLAGIVFCGRCGHRMTVAYSGHPEVMRYYCTTGLNDFRVPRCQSLSGAGLDELVTEKVFRTLEPAALEISILAAADIEEEQRQLHDHWHRRRERAQFEVDRAKRQYQLVEPENRLVARELERQWELALRGLQELELAYARTCQSSPAVLTDAQQQAIRSLAESVPKLWRSPTTTSSERQRIVRMLIERITVTMDGTSERVDVALRWSGGFVSQHELSRPVRSYQQMAESDQLRRRLIELKGSGSSYAEIAVQLEREGFRPANQAIRFNKAIIGRMAKRVCRELTKTKNTPAPLLEQHEWTLKRLSEALDIPQTTLHNWTKRGWLHVSRQFPGYRGMLVCWADPAELDRIRRLRQTPWHFGDPPLPAELTTPQVVPCRE